MPGEDVDEIRPVLPADIPARDPRRPYPLPQHGRAGRLRRPHRDRLRVDGRAPFRPPRRPAAGELRVPLLPRGADRAYPPRHRGDDPAAERSRARGRAGGHPRPALRGTLRFRGGTRLHPRRVRCLRGSDEGEPGAGRGRRRADPQGVVRPDSRVRGRVPARHDRPSDSPAGLPEAAPADLGRLPAVARELRVDREGGPQPPLRGLPRRPRHRGGTDRLVPGRATGGRTRDRGPRNLLRLSRAFPRRGR